MLWKQRNEQNKSQYFFFETAISKPLTYNTKFFWRFIHSVFDFHSDSNWIWSLAVILILHLFRNPLLAMIDLCWACHNQFLARAVGIAVGHRSGCQLPTMLVATIYVTFSLFFFPLFPPFLCCLHFS